MKIVFLRNITAATERGVKHWFRFWSNVLVLLFLGHSGMMSAADAVSAMPVISHRAPVYVSGSIPGVQASSANDGNPALMWVSNTVPAWIAYDLSSVPAGQRHQVLAAWYAPWAVGYAQPSPTADVRMPIDYTIEINIAPGGALPTTGWQRVVSITGHKHNTGQHLFNLSEANWVRLNVTASSSPSAIAIDFDVHSAPNGESDSWLFMGDSITGMAVYLFSEIPSLVHGLAPDRWPVAIGAGIGGTNSGTAHDTIDANLVSFSGRYVVLAYGTNDGDDPAFSTNLESLVLKIIAAGKIPVIPHMPWSPTPESLGKGPGINARIDALYQKYPIIRRGPDLWAAFMGRTDWIPVGDVHPTDAGNHELRRLWAVAMTANTQAVSIGLTPNSANLPVGGTAQFTAVIAGSANTGVTWGLQEGSAGGSISSTGLYTAPATAGIYHVIATSVGDPGKFASATVTVTSIAPLVALSVSPSTATVTSATTRQLTAAVTGSSNTSVVWSIQEGAAGGTVSSTGLYTAPIAAGTYHAVATSNADRSKSATVTITVAPAVPSVSVSISPSTTSMVTRSIKTFTAVVTGSTNRGVRWRVREGNAGGRVSSTGVYTAPTAPGTYHVIATSRSDSNKSAVATVTVTPRASSVSVGLTPSTATLNTGATRQFTASITGTTNTAVTWSVQEGTTGGTVSSTGLYTAPAAAGTYHVVATSNANSSRSATATITVNAVVQTVSLSLSPITASVAAGTMRQFSATITGTTNTAVTWSVQEGTTGGTVGSTGLYTAPPVAGTYHVVAKSNADPTKSASAAITVTTVVQPIAVSISPTTVSVAASGTVQFVPTVTGTANLAVTWTVQEGSTGGTISSAGLYKAPAAAGTYHVVAKSSADSTKLAVGTIVVSTTTTLKPAPVVRILRDDRVATLEMDYNADSPFGQFWNMSGSGKDDAGFLISWWPDGASPAAMGQMGGCMGCAGACGNPTDATAVSKWMVTGHRRVQIQPLANNGVYHVCVERINSLGEVTSLRTELTFDGGDSTRVDALRASMTYFDDFNLPMGAANEKLWNNASTTSTDPRFNLFFINDQYHAHSLQGTLVENTGDKSQTSQRFRQPIAIENGVRRRIVFDMDSPQSPRSVWYLDFNPIADDLTRHSSFFDEEGALGLPAGILRLRAQFQTFIVDLIDMNGASHQIASADMEALGRQAIPNVRRAFDVRVGTDGIEVIIDGKRVINTAFPANAFKPGNYSLLWIAFGYNTPKDNNPYYLMHWDNFGFDGPVRESRVTHNYVTRIAGTDYKKSQRGNSTYPTFVVKIPDDLRPTADNAIAEAWLVYNYQMGDYSPLTLLPSDSVQVNGGKAFTLPAPINNSSPLNPNLLAWGLAHTARIKLGDLTKTGASPLIVGDNTFKFFAENAGLLNVHVEVLYPKNAEPAYTTPASIHPLPMHSDLPKLGPPARFEKIGTTMINRDGYNLDDPANLVVPISGIAPINVVVGNDSWADWAPDLMVTPMRSEEVWSTGGTNGIATVELFLRSVGVGAAPGNRVAVIQTNRDAPAPQGRYTMQLDTRSLPNGNYQLFVLATTPTGLKSHPKYNGVAQRWDASQLAGAYYPITIKVQN